MAKHTHTITPSHPNTAPQGARRRRSAAAFCPPGQPPLSADELEHERWLAREMRDLAAQLHQANLDNAFLLAQQAARHGGELADHFAELGPRYHHLLNLPKKPSLRVVKGGAA